MKLQQIHWCPRCKVAHNFSTVPQDSITTVKFTDAISLVKVGNNPPPAFMEYIQQLNKA